MDSPNRLETAIDRIHFARLYTSQFLSGLSDEEWFWCPRELTTHVAWQVGHIAVAQYNLCLRRVRGRTAADETMIPDRFIDAFKLASRPAADPADNPPLAEIRRVFDAVYEQAIQELATRTGAELVRDQLAGHNAGQSPHASRIPTVEPCALRRRAGGYRTNLRTSTTNRNCRLASPMCE